MLNCSDITSSTDLGVSTSSNVTINPSASDNVDRNVTTVCSHTSNDIFSFGNTTVNCNATDNSANTENCTFRVSVIGNYFNSYEKYSICKVEDYVDCCI